MELKLLYLNFRARRQTNEAFLGWLCCSSGDCGRAGVAVTIELFRRRRLASWSAVPAERELPRPNWTSLAFKMQRLGIVRPPPSGGSGHLRLAAIFLMSSMNSSSF
jgi:hypothetical protein